MAQVQKFEGIVTKMYPVEKIGDKGTEKQTIVIEEDNFEEQYPDSVAIDFWKSGIEQVKKIKEGDKIRVAFKLSARGYNGKHYNSLSGFKLKILDKDDVGQAPVNPKDDDLPF